MSYRLDGIETAMEPGKHEVQCSCGWKMFVGWSDNDKHDHEAGRAALRFHFTHCPKAKKLPDSVPSPYHGLPIDPRVLIR